MQTCDICGSTNNVKQAKGLHLSLSEGDGSIFEPHLCAMHWKVFVDEPKTGHEAMNERRAE